MASQAKLSIAKAGGAAVAAGDLGPVQTAVLLVLMEALDADETIRSELKKKGFAIVNQALVYLSQEDARHFVVNIHNPASALYQQQQQGVIEEDDQVATTAATSPREKVTTPRSPRVVAIDPASEVDAEKPEDAINGLSHGPVLTLVLEKPNAVAELLEIVGPADPELWSSSPGCLRARFGTDPTRIGVRCTSHPTTASQEATFLLAHTHAPSSSAGSGGGHHHQKNRSSSKASAAASRAVDVKQLLDFLFPPSVHHPNSTGRLFVFGLYGPLDGHAQLRAGEKGLHVVTDRELDTMSSRMEREDLLAVYEMSSLTQEEEEQVLRTVDGTLKAFPRYTTRDVEALFHKLCRDQDGKLSFHEMQAVIMKERCRRVLCMKERLHPALAPPVQNKYRQTMTRIMKTSDAVAPAAMFIKDWGFTGAENATLVARMLSAHSFQICHLDDGNSPELTQNVQLLREQIRDPTKDHRAPWNSSSSGTIATALRK